MYLPSVKFPTGDIAMHMKAFTRIEFTADDIVRSSLTKNFIVACAKKGLLPG